VEAGSEHSTDDTIDFSTLAEIQRRLIKMGKQNVASRLIHAKSGKEKITGWKSDLSKILLVFNVRFVVFVWLLLTVHSQTELAINTHVAVSDIRHGVATTNTIISELRHNFSNTLTIVSDIHTIVKSQEGTGGQNLSVSIIYVLFTTG
jgi:hypothetical protein